MDGKIFSAFGFCGVDAGFGVSRFSIRGLG